MRTDCSGSASLIYKLAGCPDPSARGFDGYGYTGTMIAHGRQLITQVESLLVGDLIFYKWDGRPGIPDHVAVYVGGGKAFSFGHWPPQIETAIVPGFQQARRYF